MKKKGRIETYTDSELAKLNQVEGTASDWARAERLTQDEIEASVAADSEEDDMVVDWEAATVELPEPKAVLHMRVDREVLEYFRRSGRGYQSRINAVLKSYVEQQEHRHRHHR